MFFQDGLFSPGNIPDPRLRDLLTSAVAESAEPVGLLDLLAAAVRHGDEGVLSTLRSALGPGADLEAVLHAAGSRLPLGRDRISPDRASFTPSALDALDEVGAALWAGGAALARVGPQLMLCCVLARLDEQDRRRLPGLDVGRAAALFQHLVAQALGPGSEARADGPVLLPPDLAASEDLTHLARLVPPSLPSPFAGAARYDEVFDAVARALHRRRVNHVLLTGERGVGKNTIVSELARRAASGQVPFLGQRRFLRVDCRYVPPDESRARLGAIMAHVSPRPDLIVCLDGFPALLRGDRGGNNKAALLAALSRARCQVVGMLTPRDFEEHFSDDPDFAEFFARVDVEEPDLDVALKLLDHFARGLEQRYRVLIDAEAVRQAVVLSHNYVLNDHLPAKALNVLHSICEDVDYERSQLGKRRDRVAADDVVRAVSALSGVPEETLHGVAERSDYEQGLREVIFGQDHAVREVATELGLIKAGMTDASKPASVLLFLGQTGTGKTEMAKALARFYSTSKRLKTYTLGNCVEPHSVATIIGVPPGYVGADRGGRLVNELNADPYCVFLLDEADKAHPDVLQPFLNLFDEGWVADQRGARAYANKSIFILTTNVGQRMIAEMAREGKAPEEIAGRMKEALSQIRHSKSDRPVFTPEFLARIKRIIVFYPLAAGAMDGICRKLVAELEEAWQAKRGKRLEVPESLIRHVAEQSHLLNEKSQGKEGGRIVRKLIAEWVEAPVQREATLQPAAYRGCGVVRLEHASDGSPVTGASTPAVRVSFEGA